MMRMENQIGNKERTGIRALNILIVSIFFSLTIGLFIPTQIYFTNMVEFTFTLAEIFHYLIIGSLSLASAIFLLLIALSGRAHEKSVSVIFIISILIWFQGNVLIWDYGQLNGLLIDWSVLWYRGVIDGALWLALIALSLIKSEYIYKRLLRSASITLILIQLAFCVFTYYPNFSVSGGNVELAPLPSFKRYSVNDETKFDLSSRKNVIILLLDGFQSDLFNEISDKDPAIKDAFVGFTYFRNA